MQEKTQYFLHKLLLYSPAEAPLVGIKYQARIIVKDWCLTEYAP